VCSFHSICSAFALSLQAYELWFKQTLLEIDSVRNIFSRNPVEEAAMGEAVHRLQRIREIQNVMLAQIPVLETMTPLEFLDFRDALYPASGFQSAQFRLVENKLGLPPAARLSYGLRGYCTYLNEKDAETVKSAEAEPSLHELINAWLERTPFLSLGTFDFWEHYRAAVTAMIDEDERVIRANAHLQATPELILQQVSELTKQREHFASLFDAEKYAACVARGERRMSYKAMQAALLITLYHDQPMLTLPYRLLQCLVDIDENFTLWRYRHALMVHRMLGSKVGTGGSSGYHYLRSTAERHKIFTDLSELSCKRRNHR
jgi:tryptophan 2,3-dioxygenase